MAVLKRSIGTPVVVAITTDRVERFEHEAGWVDLLMTAGARLHGLMLGELLADGGRAPRVSGSMPPAFGGGGGAGVPMTRSSNQAPRSTGDVFAPFAVTFRMLA